MEETTYFAKSGVRVTDQQISTKSDSVLIRDVSAVQVKSAAGTSLFGFLLSGVCALLAFGASQNGNTGLAVVAVIAGLAFLGASLSGRKVVVTTHGGKQIEVASGLVGEMREAKNAIARAMTSRNSI
jgi:hypothetical protein